MILNLLFYLMIFIAFSVQSLTGMGGPLVAMPMGTLLIGMGLSKPIVTFCAFFTSGLVVITCFKDIDLHQYIKMTAFMLAGVFGGVFIFNSLNIGYLKVIYGIIIIIIGVWKLFFKGKDYMSKKAQYLYLAAAGIMQGLFVSGGCFLAVYATSAMKQKEKFRATMSALWTTINAIMLITYLFNKTYTRQNVVMIAIAVIPVVLAVIAGSLFAKKVNQKFIVKIIYSIILFSGITIIITSILNKIAM